MLSQQTLTPVNGVESVLLNNLDDNNPFEPGPQNLENLSQLRVLVVGAGGLGCEIVKDLALIGFKHIEIIDMDTIDLTNLNRQFLFRHKDIGRSKAVVAAEFVTDRVDGVTVIPHFNSIQEMDNDFYRSFHIVICGLDSVEARRWINAKLVDLVDEADPRSLKPLIDGGTEGMLGQARVILPTLSACYECSLGMLARQATYPLCTIATNPRLPEHCIQWASQIAWPANFDRPPDNDNLDDMTWVYHEALKRAQMFQIEGITLELTQGVLKRIIPAIASTNAIIASACCTEALKIATSCAPYLDNYMMYSGVLNVYTHTFSLDKKPDCPVCGSLRRQLTVPAKLLLSDFIDSLIENPEYGLKKPSLSLTDRSLYLRGPLEEMTKPNLLLPLDQLMNSGDEIAITDETLPFNLRLTVWFS